METEALEEEQQLQKKKKQQEKNLVLFIGEILLFFSYLVLGQHWINQTWSLLPRLKAYTGYCVDLRYLLALHLTNDPGQDLHALPLD